MGSPKTQLWTVSLIDAFVPLERSEVGMWLHLAFQPSTMSSMLVENTQVVASIEQENKTLVALAELVPQM